MHICPDKEIGASEAAELRESGGPVTFLDVREPDELAICSIHGARHVPMGKIPEAVGALPREEPLVVLCHHGMRSLHVVNYLRERGFANAVSMRGGIDAWALEVDAAVPRY